jgi:putative ABC transport system permease protein
MRKTFIKKGMREIWANKFKYFFLVLVVGLGMASYGAMFDMASSRGATLDANYKAAKFMDVQVVVDYGQTINQSTLEELFSRPVIANQIKEVEYRLSFEVFLNHTRESEIKTTRGLVIGYQVFDGSGTTQDLDVNKPLYFTNDPPGYSTNTAKECFLENKYAKAYGLGSGDSITVLKDGKETELEILERTSIPEFFWVIPEGSLFPAERSYGVLTIPHGTAQSILAPNSEELLFNDIAILVNDYNEDTISDFEDVLADEFQSVGLVVKTTAKEENLARRLHYDDYENDKQNTATFPVVIFTISAFGLIITLRRMIRTHRTQIGIFKSLGIPNRTVMLYFGIIGVMISILGLIVGILLSIPIRMFLVSLAFDLLGFAIQKTSIAFEQYIISGAIAVAICMATTLIPAWLALRIKPVDAIQTREGISKKSAGRIAMYIGRSRKIPTPIKLTIRNLFRKPSRSFVTIAGVALSLSLFLGFAVVLHSVIIVLDQNTASNEWDYEVTMEGFTPINATDHWGQMYPEIETVNPGIKLPTYVWDGDDKEVGIIYALDDIEAAYRMDMESGSITPGSIVISKYISEKMGLRKGDIIQADVPTFDPEIGFALDRVTIPISGIHNNHIGFYVFMDLDTFHTLTGLYGMANVIYLNMEGGKPVQELENTLITTRGVSAVTHIDDMENMLASYFEIFVGVVITLGVISVILAAAIVYNLFMIDAEEKRRDYATMKTLGTSLRKISYIIFLEASITTVFGIIFGTIGGYLLCYYFLFVAGEFDVMNLKVFWSWPSFLGGAALMIVTIYVVALITIRYISKINIADVIRERTN